MNRPMHRVPVAAALVVLTVLGACGGDSKADTAAEEAAQATTDGVTADGTTTTAKRAAGDKAGSATKPSKKAQTADAKAAASTPTTTPDKEAVPGQSEKDKYAGKLEMSAEVTEPCVRPGGLQTLTVRTKDNAGIAFDTVYADGLSGLKDGHYGGNDGGYTDDDGTYTATWTVAATAPKGPAAVNVLGSHYGTGIGETHTSFKVADPLGNCE